MKHILLFLVTLLFMSTTVAQVGINNENPQAILDITAGSTPSNTDGILIPRVAEYPTGMTTAQDGMLVFITGAGAPTKGFYYYSNGVGWLPIVGASGPANTLDQAYDEGGAGSGNTIIADSGAVSIEGEDGFQVTGTFGSGNDVALTGAGTRMFFSPKKGAFRAGRVNNTQWDHAFLGDYSFAAGRNTIAFGENSIAMGFDAGSYRPNATAIGYNVSANGDNSMVLGSFVTASSYGETALGLFGTNQVANSVNSIDLADRVFSIGNGTDISNRKNALTIFKSGLLNINEEYNMPLVDGTLGQVMTTDGAGNLTFTAPSGGDDDWYISNTTNTPTAITDNLVTQGSVTIGNSLSGGLAKLNVYSNDTNPTTFRIDNSGTIGLENRGMTISNNSLSGTSSERFVGILAALSSSDGFSQTGLKSEFDNMSASGLYYGVLNEFQAGSSNGHQRGFRNYFGGGEVAYGIENVFPGAFTYSGTTYGVNNTLQSQGNGTKYGTFNNLSGSGSGAKYGTYTTIDNAAGGTHYGIYADAQNATGYAGYFIGRTSLGATTTNRYLMPLADGSFGQVMTTDGSGNISFQNDETGNDWTINGNAATNPTTNFIGTTDLQDFSIRTENTEKVRITTQGQIETYNTGGSVFIGELAGENDDLSDNQNVAIGLEALQTNIISNKNVAVGFRALKLSTTDSNTAVGWNALSLSTSGAQNTGIGYAALRNTTTGEYNTALGYQALNDNTIGFGNTAAGRISLNKNIGGNYNTANGFLSLSANTNGDENTAIGFNALSGNITGNFNAAIGSRAGLISKGNNNTYLGFRAGDSDAVATENVYIGAFSGGGDYSGLTMTGQENKSGNIFVGYRSGFDETGSNKLYIENSDSDTPLIYGEFDNNILRANGELQVGDPTGTGYALPTADGTSGQVLTTDGAGNIAFITPSGGGGSQNTLNEAYDEGGAGVGKNIDATDGAVRINGTDGFLVTGTINSGNTINTEITGAGTRMFFNPNTASFRAGQVDGTQWDTANIGLRSAAFGNNNTASGSASTALGANNISSGNRSVTIGETGVASGQNSIAIGDENNASANNTLAHGFRSTASATDAFAANYQTTASGIRSFATGSGTEATGQYSFTGGLSSIASGVGSTAFGILSEAPSWGEFTVGLYPTTYTVPDNWTFEPTERVFTVGNGANAANRSNALTVYKSGLVNINEEYDLPLTDGTNGQVITTDGSGNLSFQSVSGGGPNTDDQQIDVLNLNGTTLEISLQDDGVADETLDLSSLQDGNTQNTLDQAYDEGGAGAGRTINATDGAVTINGDDGFIVNSVGLGIGDDISPTNGAILMFFNPKSGAFRTGQEASTNWHQANLGDLSFAQGHATMASGPRSFAINSATVASSLNTFAAGISSTASGDMSAVFGTGNTAFSNSEFVIGRYSTIYTPVNTTLHNNADRLFVVGNGFNTGTRSNALTIYKNGTMNINDAYNMPTADGANGQVMTTDGAGNASWQNAATTASLSLARITMNSNQSYTTTGSWQKVNYNTTEFDITANFNTTSNAFIAPTTGHYRVNAVWRSNGSSISTASFGIGVYVAGTLERAKVYDHPGSGQITRSLSSIIALTAGESVEIYLNPGSPLTISLNDIAASFEIEQIR